jgi:hypothetical protein
MWVIYAAWAAAGGIDLDSSAHQRHSDRRSGRLSKAERMDVAHCFVQMTPRRDKRVDEGKNATHAGKKHHSVRSGSIHDHNPVAIR